MPPAGFKRSRALWDDARRPRERKVEEWKSLLRAILYELQPIRFSQYHHSFSYVTRPQAIGHFLSSRVLPVAQRGLVFMITVVLPTIGSFIRNLTARQWMMVGGVVMYYFMVRWIHEYVGIGGSISKKSRVLVSCGICHSHNFLHVWQTSECWMQDP